MKIAKLIHRSSEYIISCLSCCPKSRAVKMCAVKLLVYVMSYPRAANIITLAWLHISWECTSMVNDSLPITVFTIQLLGIWSRFHTKSNHYLYRDIMPLSTVQRRTVLKYGIWPLITQLLSVSVCGLKYYPDSKSNGSKHYFNGCMMLN